MSVQSIREETTATYEADIVDESPTPAPVPAAALVSLTLTLYERKTGTIINGRDAQNVLNANDVTVDAQGHLTWRMAAADNQHIAGNGTVEVHVALFEYSYGSPVKKGNHELYIQLQGVKHVP